MNVEEPAEVHQANYDAHSAMLSSFLDLRISYLRVCVDMQENPKSVNSTVEMLKTKIDDSTAFWTQLLERSQVLKQRIDELEARLEDMKVDERFMKFIINIVNWIRIALLLHIHYIITTMECKQN